MDNYWINEGIKFIVLFSSAFFLGLWVKKRGVKVNYTRKIFHFILFFLPVYLASIIPFEASLSTTALSGLIFLLCISTMAEPIRLRSEFISTVFTAIDRPEDRPYTLLWVFTQVMATYIVLIFMLAWWSSYGMTELIYITILIAGIGDGLAEPVGVRFGKRKYQVRALFTDRKYTRSIEGSLCVFLSAVLAIILLQDQLTFDQFVLGMLIIPTVTTLAEAFSPHTWDGPFIYLAGGISTLAMIEVSQFLNFT